MYPPAGYPNPQGDPRPMPPPPWQQQYGSAPQSAPQVRKWTKWLPLVIGFVTMLAVMGGLLFMFDEDGRYFSSGDRVTPTSDEYMVFVDTKYLPDGEPGSVQCTARAESGDELTVPAPTEPHETSRGSRSTARKYRAVAELPTDRGTLTVRCTSEDGGVEYLGMLLTKPEKVDKFTLFIVGYGTLMAVLVSVVVVMRRRYFRKYPRPDSGFRM